MVSRLECTRVHFVQVSVSRPEVQGLCLGLETVFRSRSRDLKSKVLVLVSRSKKSLDNNTGKDSLSHSTGSTVRSWSRSSAVSPQVTEAIKVRSRLPLLSLKHTITFQATEHHCPLTIRYQIILLHDAGSLAYEQPVQSRYAAPESKPSTTLHITLHQQYESCRGQYCSW